MEAINLVWKNCGYLSLSKNGKNVTVVVKHVRYFAKLEELREVLEGKKAYALVCKPPEKEEVI